MFNNNETKDHIPLHRALRVRRGGGRYQYYKLHDGLHPGDELKEILDGNDFDQTGTIIAIIRCIY